MGSRRDTVLLVALVVVVLALALLTGRADPGGGGADPRPSTFVSSPSGARALGAFLRLFEPVAFGGRGLDAEGWERMRTAAAEGGAGA